MCRCSAPRGPTARIVEVESPQWPIRIEGTASKYLDALSRVTDTPPALERTFLSAAHTASKRMVAAWMVEAGMEVFEDTAGNLIGRLAATNPDAPVFVCGSHLDTVRNAGRYDGALGVVAGVLAAARLAPFRDRLPWHLEVVGFSDEEGARFGTTYLGSKTYVGTLHPRDTDAMDEQGVSIADAIAAHQPEFPPPPPRPWIAGYVEVHIEQGPVLESSGKALGVVSAIAGQTRARVTVDGKAGHAGTTPMTMRQDALVGAADCILLLEQRAQQTPGLVATVGELRVRDGASNVIPGQVSFSVDVRHSDNRTRMAFCREVFAGIEQHLALRKLQGRIEFGMTEPAVVCDPELTRRLMDCVEERQAGECPQLVSGAGHDAVTLANVTATAMLFVRCREGLSHHPDEYASPDDVELATRVLGDFLEGFLR